MDHHYFLDLKDLKLGDHLCCLYETEEEHRNLLTPFLRLGLERGEKVIYIVDFHTARQVIDYLINEQINIKSFLDSGQFNILTVTDTYMKDGVFDPDKMIDTLRTETGRAIEEGYTGLRVTGEMTWALKDLPGADRLIEYESKLNHFFPGSNCIAICQYDVREFEPDLLLNILTTHPFAVIGTEIYDNFYYISPDLFMSKEFSKNKLIHWINHLKERKKIQEKIIESGEKYKNLFENSPIGIGMSTFDGKILELNETMAKISGYTQEEFLNVNLKDTYRNPEDRMKIMEILKKDGYVKNFEVELKRKDGSTFFALLTTTVMKFEGSDVVLAIVEDITERKNAEIKLRESEENYRRAFNRSELYKDLLTHDLKNILQSLLLATQLGFDSVDLDNPEQLKKSLLRIKDQINKIDKLTNNVSKITRLEESNKILRRVEVFKVLKESMGYVRDLFHHKEIKFELNGDFDEFYVNANDFLSDIFENILHNAIKFNQNSEIQISIKLSEFEKNGIDYLRMEFRDNGIGISDTRKEQIFLRASDIPRDKTLDGMGLGLSIIDKIMRSYDGKIWVEDIKENNVVKGSNFILLIPKYKQKEKNEQS